MLLNPNQQKAVEVLDKPLIINAGPGTGKTKTLIEKVKYLMGEGVTNILVLTFTEKAAKEIQSRLKIEQIDLKGFAGTFHALALKLIPDSKEFKIVPNTLRRNIIETCLVELKSDLNLKDAELIITKYKNSVTEGSDKALIDLYNSKLEEAGYLDFDDLLIRLLGILRFTQNDPSSQSYEGQAFIKYGYILVDEFQDTNLLQYKILKKLSSKNNICVIGDPLQSIYGFRGSSSSIFEQFKADFSNDEEIILNINYRSTKEIIETSHQLFPEFPLLKSNSKLEGSVKLIKTTNEYTEADFVIREISKSVGGIDLIEGSDYAHEDQKANFSDFAIIYRTHSQARILKQKFRECGIPYQVVGEGSIYDSKQFEFLFNALSYIYLDTNEVFFEQIAADFVNQLKELKLMSKGLEFSEIAGEIIGRFGLLDKIKSKELLTDFQDLQNNLIRFNKYGQTAFENYKKYISELQTNQGYDVRADKVTLLTIHASKGLEFAYVFICGLEEGNIPLARSVQEGNQEEEKRLLYVAMTRAKNYLYLITTKFRNKEKQSISTFLNNISKSEYLITEEDEAAKKLDVKKEKIKQKKSQFKMF